MTAITLFAAEGWVVAVVDADDYSGVTFDGYGWVQYSIGSVRIVG